MANSSLEILLQIATECHDLLEAAGVPHVVMGGLAVCLHGGKLDSRDVDLIVRCEDWYRIRQAFQSARYVWRGFRKAYYSPNKVRVDFRFGGDDAGNGEVFLPDPGANQVCETNRGLPVLALAHLVETKLACALTGQRGQEKHHADVAGLIVAKKLSGSYGDRLHPSVRAEFCKVVAEANRP